MGTVYLIHFNSKYKHAQHYIGSTEQDLAARLAEHHATRWELLAQPVIVDHRDGTQGIKIGQAHGKGATLLGVLNSLNIGFEVVRTWR